MTLLHGWGRTAGTAAHRRRPRRLAQLRHALEGCGERGVIARGLGRSYGDPAQNGGGIVCDMTAMGAVHRLDVDGATVEVDAGASLDLLLGLLFPLGLTLPVQPGTRQVTVGGAIASDIHGKNHHVSGSFGDHVEWLDLLTADGEVRRIGPTGSHATAFWATVGGMGLTGIVLGARLRLRRVETASIVVRSERHRHLQAVMDALVESDTSAEYSVAWFDSLQRGRLAGRGVVLSGRDAVLDDLPRSRRHRAFEQRTGRGLSVPITPPASLVGRASGRVFNELWYRAAPAAGITQVQDAFAFFHPLDGIASWNRLYGPRGLTQYQLAVPHDAYEVVPQVIAAIAASGHVSCLNVLKRFGAGNQAPMSFPQPGWTLAVDLPVGDGLGALLDRLDSMVLEAGGRIYLAKDARLPRAHLDRMYPRLDEFLALKERLDPQCRFRSDLARRLGLGQPQGQDRDHA